MHQRFRVYKSSHPNLDLKESENISVLSVSVFLLKSSTVIFRKESVKFNKCVEYAAHVCPYSWMLFNFIDGSKSPSLTMRNVLLQQLLEVSDMFAHYHTGCL